MNSNNSVLHHDHHHQHDASSHDHSHEHKHDNSCGQIVETEQSDLPNNSIATHGHLHDVRTLLMI
jgi:hypothetical protein